MRASSLLIVDSYQGSRRALGDFLRDCGYEVHEAHNGMEGLRLVNEVKPALVIVDLWPFFSASVHMVERLRRGARGEPIEVLVLTSAVSSQHKGRALAAGCAGFLEKPCPAEEVLAEVRRILDSPAQRRKRPNGRTHTATQEGLNAC
jgi:DNA-binding response OmpR family regulator